MTLIKSISGIRGIVGGTPGESLTPPDLVKFTAAYSTWVRKIKGGKPKVVLGRDARISGEMVSDIVEGTLLACGVDVIALGMATTPTVEVAVTACGADGGIILTASHNPRQWNALKLLGGNGEFLSAAEGAEILGAAAADRFEYADVDGIGKVLERTSFDSRHIDMVLSLPLVDVEAVYRRGFKVVVDAVNSVGGTVIPELLRRMGVNVVELNCVPDGNFAHNPEPLPENLTELSRVVAAEGADLGIAVDPDVDRLALVNEDGTMFGEEYTLVAVADYVLSQQPGNNTVSNLSSSRALKDVTARYGGSYSASPVGEVNVVAEMKKTGAVIGGEGNGGVIYPALHYGRDALVGTALFLTYLARKEMTMSELRATYPQYYISKNKIELAAGTDTDGILAKIKEKYASEQLNDADGVKIDFSDEWVHLRKSNTEPIIRIYAESRDEASADALAARIMYDIKGLI